MTIANPTHAIAQSGGRLLDGYASAVLMLILAVIYLDLAVFLNTLNDAIAPKYFYFAFIPLIVPMLLSRHDAIAAYLGSPFSVWAISLMALNVAHLTFAVGAGEAERTGVIVTNVQYIGLTLILGSVLASVRPALYRGVFPVIAIVVFALVVIDFLNPGMLYPLEVVGAVIGRGAGTFINPNRAGEGILMVTLLSIAVAPPRLRVVLLVGAGVASALTFSRAAMVGWALLWIYLAMIRALPRSALPLLIVAALAAPVVTGYVESYLHGRDDLAEGLDNIQDRLDFFKTRDFGDESATEREEVLKGGMELFLAHPFVGAGAGITFVRPTVDWPYPVSTHNSPVMLAGEFGLLGLAMWLWLLVIVWRGEFFANRRLQGAVAGAVIFFGLFTHNMCDSLYWLLSFSLLSQRLPSFGNQGRTDALAASSSRGVV